MIRYKIIKLVGGKGIGIWLTLCGTETEPGRILKLNNLLNGFTILLSTLFSVHQSHWGLSQGHW